MGVGGAGRSTKKIFAQVFMLWPKKKIHTRNFGNEKKFLLLENPPPPPITFLMVRPLVQKTKKTENLYRHTIYSLYCYIEINFFEHQ